MAVTEDSLAARKKMDKAIQEDKESKVCQILHFMPKPKGEVETILSELKSQSVKINEKWAE